MAPQGRDHAVGGTVNERCRECDTRRAAWPALKSTRRWAVQQGRRGKPARRRCGEVRQADQLGLGSEAEHCGVVGSHGRGDGGTHSANCRVVPQIHGGGVALGDADQVQRGGDQDGVGGRRVAEANGDVAVGKGLEPRLAHGEGNSRALLDEGVLVHCDDAGVEEDLLLPVGHVAQVVGHEEGC